MQPLIIPFFIPHAGCPHSCLFCNQHLISGVIQPIPDRRYMQEQIDAWLQRSPGRPTEVALYGGSFTLLDQALQDSLLDTIQPYIKKGLVQGIRISTRPDGLVTKQLQYLKDHQVRTVEIGVQSLNDDVLQLSGRGHSASDSLQAIKRTRAAGFLVGAQLLPGLPGDTPARALAGVREVIAAGVQFIRIYPAVVLQGTVLADQFQNGLYNPPDLEQGIKIAALMLDCANKSGIPVVRIGLQADEELSRVGAILAGCWHPALGQLVKAQLFHDLVCQLALQMQVEADITIFCHPRQLSEVIGCKRNNLFRWQQAGIPVVGVQVDNDINLQQIRLEYLQYKITGSLITTQIYKENIDA